MAYIVGAYALSPSHSTWDANLESQYFSALKAMPNVKGIEHPFINSLHAHDDEWFLANISPTWEFVFTTIPGIMGAISQNPKFGIASDSEEDRQAALNFYNSARLAILKLNKHLGRQAVTAIQIHTSPNQEKSSSSAVSLESSLTTMLSWNWDGAQLVIEHCDAYVEGQAAQKGFLSLEDEITALKNVNKQSTKNKKVGITINWGRSAIETQSAAGVIDHINQVKAANLLTGLMFSGASDVETPYGVWKDTHMPPAQAFDITSFAQGSLLTADEIKKSLIASDHKTLSYLGLKIGVRPNSISVEERVAYNRGGLAIIDQISRSL